MKRLVVSIIITLGFLTSSHAITPEEKNFQDLKSMSKQAQKTSKEDGRQVLEVYNNLNEEEKVLFRKLLVDSMAQKLNQNVPAQIDKYTMLTKVTPGDNGNITFNYQISDEGVKVAETGDTVKGFMKKLNTFTACKKAETKIFFDMGITINYHYSSATADLFNFTVAKEDCIKPKPANK